MAKGDYSDIIDLPRPTFPGRKKLTPSERAAQFLSFAALTGFEEALEQTRDTVEREAALREAEAAGRTGNETAE